MNLQSKSVMSYILKANALILVSYHLLFINPGYIELHSLDNNNLFKESCTSGHTNTLLRNESFRISFW